MCWTNKRWAEIQPLDIDVNNDDLHYEALESHQRKKCKSKYTQKIYPWEDQGPWTHGVIVEPINDDHRECSYAIQVTKTGRLITQNSKHICSTSITAEEYLCDQIKKS